MPLRDHRQGGSLQQERAQAEAYLYRLFVPSFYESDSPGVLTGAGETVLREALDAAYGEDGGFRAQYCRAPLPKDNVSWLNKNGRGYSRIAGRETDQGYRLSALEIHVSHGRQGQALASLSPDPCTATLPGGFHRGDHVMVDYYGSQREGFVAGPSGEYLSIMFGRSANDVESMYVNTVRRHP